RPAAHAGAGSHWGGRAGPEFLRYRTGRPRGRPPRRSGADRSGKENPDENKNRYYEQPLKNIFSKIHFEKRDQCDDSFFKLRPFIPENIYSKADVTLSRDDYQRIAEKLANDFEKLSGLPYDNFLSALSAILEYNLSFIPASTIDEPDVSLFDHLSTTAAISAVLYSYHQTTDTIEEEEIKDYSKKKFLLVSGDLSGIQRYIFNLKSTKYSAKTLRAKSFELQALTESVSSSILEKFNLPEMCKLVNAGGRFILLLPNTKETIKQLDQIRKEVEQYCLERYFGELTLNISQGLELSAGDFSQENAEAIFRKISKVTSVAKQKKLQNALSDGTHMIEKEYENIRGAENVCSLCDARAVTEHGNCRICNSLISVGGRIPKSQYLGFIQSDMVEKSSFNLFNSIKMRTSPDIGSLGEGVFPYRINEYEPGFPTANIPYYIPADDSGDVKTFEDLAKLSDGIEKIAMFKADLDNLGAVFSIGLGEKISISRYSTISRMTNYFFSTYLNDLLKHKYKNIYTIFSGGDDLCLIGPWTDIVDFSIEFQKKFKEFTGENDSISISGGIALSSPKVPVSNISQRAEKALEMSKHKDNLKSKITLFDTTVSWTGFERLIHEAENLSDKLEKKDNNSFSKAVVYRLLEYGERERNLKNGKANSYNALWRSHLRYDAARNIKNYKDRKEFLSMVEKNIHGIKLIANYALYKNRKKEKVND
ncbi:MAG: type III-A CRISPR-associated protein Cas10/Csm1, partial [bacterium]